IDKVIREGPTTQDLLEDDEVIADWIKTTVTGHWHASCTCRMGGVGDPNAVTDPTARVYGVEGLRVCDASIMPRVPRANTNFPTIMMAEKVAEGILAGR
ncbi:MAG: GMC oxidoreductase, partial [Pseudomonadota bacterium]|nr:GMC oxidoreductase [Pseudomonadota bacterium]